MPERNQHRSRALVCRSRRRQENARLIVSQIILDIMKELRMSYPKVRKARLKELQAIRKEL